MAKVTKVSDKLAKASDSFTVYIYDNGYMVEVSGRDQGDDWSSAKIMCADLDGVMAIAQEIAEMERD